MEIERLHKMLTDAGIEHEWLDRASQFRFSEADFNWGYQIIVYKPNGDRLVSAIEGFGTYGYGGFDHGVLGTTEKDGDLIEIMGLLTPEEEEDGSVVGYLTAEEVFRRIQEALCGSK